MKLIEALSEINTTVQYLRSQMLARPLDPAEELKPLSQASAALRGNIKLDGQPRMDEVASLAERCRLVDYDLRTFSRREQRLLCWDNGLLKNSRFRQGLLPLVEKGEVRPNLSILAKIYFGAWGEQENQNTFEQLLRFTAERQPDYSETVGLYKQHSSQIFSTRADSFLSDQVFASDDGVSSTLRLWDIPPQSSLASRFLQNYLHRLLLLIEDNRGGELGEVLATIQLPAVKLEVFRQAIGRLILCSRADRDDVRKPLETFILDHPHLGDPRNSGNAPHWVGIDPRAEQKFRGWRNRIDLVFFFNSVMKDRDDKHGRKDFWLTYVNLAHESFVALCDTDAYRLRDSLWREKIQFRKLLDDQGVSCFVMRFKTPTTDFVIAEFSKVGAVRIFPYKSFVEKFGGNIERQKFWLKELRNDDQAVARFVHRVGWQHDVRNHDGTLRREAHKMTLVLAQLGEVALTATDDGLVFSSSLPAQLSSRTTWPAKALQCPEGLQTAMEIEQCLELGYAHVDGHTVVIPYQHFPEIRRSGMAITTRWAEWCPFLLKIDRINDIGRTNFQYKYSFVIESNPVAFNRAGYFGKREGSDTLYQLEDQTYALVTEMERFNSLGTEQKTRAESWLVFSRVKECATEVGASLDRYLQSNDVVVPKSLQLSIHHWPDGSISFAPQVAGVTGDGLKKAFFSRPTAENFYSIDGPNNSHTRIVFDERQTEVLERMKSVHKVYDRKLKQSLIEKPEMAFDGLIDAVEVRYGRRVEGVGRLEALNIPSAPRENNALGPAIALPPDQTTIGGESNGLDGRAVKSSASEQNDLFAAAKHAVESGAQTFIFQRQELHVDEVLKDLLERKESQSSGQSKGAHDQKYLLPYRDEDHLKPWDLEDAEHARRPVGDSMEFISPNCLAASVRLKDHQKDGVRWLQNCHRLRPRRRGSLLADDMGLGKTLQILTYLGWCIEHDHELGLSKPTAPWRPILVVVPLILLENRTWEKEIEERFAGGVFHPILVLHGDAIKSVRKSKPTGTETSLGAPSIPHTEFTKNRLVITNYQTIVNYQHSFAQLLPDTQKSIWSVVVTDEAQEYKAPTTKISHAIKALHPDFHIACTGTPVENRLLDLWNVVDAIQPALLGTAQDFRTNYEQTATPLSDRLTRLKQNLLFGSLNAFLIRRDKSEVLDLPSKTITPIFSNMTDWEVRTHRDLVISGAKGSPLKVLQKLVALYQHPALLEENTTTLEPAKLLAQSSKLRSVMDKLKDIRKRGEKVVIFAYRIEMQQILAVVISAEFGIAVDIINGTREKGGLQGSAGSQSARQNRQQKLDRFQKSNGFNVIVLSPFVASIGLNITQANHVIHYGRWWNPAIEAQATDRVYRIGQEKPVFVYLPILRDESKRLAASFDECLHELISAKQQQAKEFLTPLPEEDRLGEEMFLRLKGDSLPTNPGEPITSETIDALPPHLFESLVACLLENAGYRTVLTVRSNDHGADVLGFDGSVWLVQVKHTKRDLLIGSVAMSDLMAARMSYVTPRAYSVRLMAVTNGNFSRETQDEAAKHGIVLLDRRELMAKLRASPLTMGRVYTREEDRCKSFDQGIREARQWFEN